MSSAFILAIRQTLWVLWSTIRYLPYGGWRYFPKRLLVFLIALPIFGLLQLSHWIGFLCDEIFFRQYKNIAIKRPVFIAGIPRSGTTHLHRVLARHEVFTTMQTWECVFAPSITERYIGHLVGKCMNPLRRHAEHIKFPFFRKMQTIHTLAFNAPEEDFITLVPIHACFLLVLVYPEAQQLWRLADFDDSMPAKQRRTIMGFYHKMIQKHLYWQAQSHQQGAEQSLRYLCKNPTFTSWLNSLKRSFPDADFILCTRPAEKALISQLSALLPGWQLFHGAVFTRAFESQVVDMLAGYYHAIETFEQDNSKAAIVPMSELTQQLESTIRRLMVHVDVPMTKRFARKLHIDVVRARHYRSQHKYQQQAFSVRWAEVSHLFDSRLAGQARSSS